MFEMKLKKKKLNCDLFNKTKTGIYLHHHQLLLKDSLNAADAKLIQQCHLTVTTSITSIESKVETCPRQWKSTKTKAAGFHCAPLLVSIETLGLVDGFLRAAGAHRHFTCINLVAVPVWRLDGQRAADVESAVRLLNSGAGRDPSAHWTPSSQPADICKRHRLTGHTDQSGFVGLELSAGRREECEDRRREAGACKSEKWLLEQRHRGWQGLSHSLVGIQQHKHTEEI